MRYADKGTQDRAFAEGTSVRYTRKGAKPERNEYIEKGICILSKPCIRTNSALWPRYRKHHIAILSGADTTLTRKRDTTPAKWWGLNGGMNEEEEEESETPM